MTDAVEGRGRLTPTEIVAQIRTAGFAKIDGFLSPDLVQKIRAEMKTYREATMAHSPGGVQGAQRAPSIYPHSLARRFELSRIRATSQVVADPIVDETRRIFMGPWSYVSDIVNIESTPADRIVTRWHIDAGLACIADPEGYRLKFFFYLNDVTAENGAFSYLPRSHTLLEFIFKAMSAGQIPAGRIWESESLAEICGQHLALFSPEHRAVVDMMSATIGHGAAAPGSYSLEGPAGTLIIFDERGLHRGGDISGGLRSVLRISFQREKWSSVGGLARTLARKAGRVVLPAPYARLM